MQIAFYKGKGGFFNKLIRWWTKHEYTHTELIIDGIWYTSSHTDGGVVERQRSGLSGNWDIYEVTGDKKFALHVYDEVKGAKYDWLGIILSQVFPLKIHNKQRWFCSELNGKMLDVKDPHQHSPAEIFKLLKRSNRIGDKIV